MHQYRWGYIPVKPLQPPSFTRFQAPPGVPASGMMRLVTVTPVVLSRWLRNQWEGLQMGSSMMFHDVNQ